MILQYTDGYKSVRLRCPKVTKHIWYSWMTLPPRNNSMRGYLKIQISATFPFRGHPGLFYSYKWSCPQWTSRFIVQGVGTDSSTQTNKSKMHKCAEWETNSKQFPLFRYLHSWLCVAGISQTYSPFMLNESPGQLHHVSLFLVGSPQIKDNTKQFFDGVFQSWGMQACRSFSRIKS